MRQRRNTGASFDSSAHRFIRGKLEDNRQIHDGNARLFQCLLEYSTRARARLAKDPRCRPQIITVRGLICASDQHQVICSGGDQGDLRVRNVIFNEAQIGFARDDGLTGGMGVQNAQ